VQNSAFAPNNWQICRIFDVRGAPSSSGLTIGLYNLAITRWQHGGGIGLAVRALLLPPRTRANLDSEKFPDFAADRALKNRL